MRFVAVYLALLSSLALGQARIPVDQTTGTDLTLSGDSTADQFFATHSTADDVGLYLKDDVKICWSTNGADTAKSCIGGHEGVSAGQIIISGSGGAGGGNYLRSNSGYYLGSSGECSWTTTSGLFCAAGSARLDLNQGQTGVTTIIKNLTGATGTAQITGSASADGTAGVAAVTLFTVQTGISGTPVSKFTITGDGHVSTTYTDISGTPGNATINKMAGKVSVAIGASSVTVTNALVTANSNVLVTIQELDATCTQLLRAVPTGGQFVITLNANCTQDTNVGWIVFN